MAAYIVTGALGAGKTLAAVGRIREYLERGLPVATNIDLDVSRLLPSRPKAPVYRLPDRPVASDFEALGHVHDTGREDRNGAVLLDECGTWLNAREWSDKGRPALLDWFLHSRKLGWDLYFVVQSVELLDKQVRDVFKRDYQVACKRLDRMRVPYVGAALRALTFGAWQGRMPAVHVGVVTYGHGHGAVIADRWWYRGRDLWGAYSTAQRIGRESDGLFCYLHPGSPDEVAERARARALRERDARKRPEVLRAMSLPPEVRFRALHAVWAGSSARRVG